MGPKPPVIGRKKRETNLSKMARKKGNYDFAWDKTKFVQASMKFVLINKTEDGGCKQSDEIDELIEEYGDESESGTDSYLANFYEANEQIKWRDVVQVN